MSIKILVLASNSQQTDKLRLQQEMGEIETAISKGIHRDQYIVRSRIAIRVNEIERSLLRETPRIVHFCGEENGSPGLKGGDLDEKTEILAPQGIINSFKLLKNQVECVVLHGLDFRFQAELIQQQINYVIVAQQEIRADAATAFNQGFYEALSNGATIEQAYKVGCNRIQTQVYGNGNGDRKLIPVYAKAKNKWIELPQHKVIQLFKRDSLNQIESTLEHNQKENLATESTLENNQKANLVPESTLGNNQKVNSATESKANQVINNISVYGGNYNENIAGSYQQNTNNSGNSREEILQRDFIKHSPYKGLKRFNDTDKNLFFGREKLTTKLIEAVNQNNLLLVLGASGSGKSSVVRAGVMTQIDSRSTNAYEACLFIPNRDPFVSWHRSLLSANQEIFTESEVEFILQGKEDTFNQAITLLKSKHSPWLMVIDQFEELFTICQNLETRRNFIQGMMQIAQDPDPSIKLILTMRSDFIEEFSAYPQFAELAEKNINLVADMQPEELRQAIEQPAANHGVVFEPGLVAEIIQDVQGQAGSLPLLQYTLDLLWQDDDLSDRTLNIITYRNLGGVTGALQKHVNEIYDQFTPEQQLATKQIFLRLVNVVGQVGQENSEEIRSTVSRRAYKSEFTETQLETVNLLINKKLLVSNDQEQQKQSTVEIAHEALLTSWKELQDWITDARNTITLHSRLAEDAANWQLLKKSNQQQANEELWTGSKLEKAIESREDKTFDLILGGISNDVNNFIDVSLDWRDRKIQQELATAQKLAQADRKARIEAEQRVLDQKKAKKTSYTLLSGLCVVTLCTTFFGFNSQSKTQEAQLKERAASIGVKLSVSNEIEPLLESIDLVGDNQKFNDRLFNFREKNELLPEVKSILYQSLEESKEISSFNGYQESINAIAFSNDGKYLVTGSGNSNSSINTVKLWDVQQHKLIHTFDDHDDQVESHQGRVNSVAFTPNNEYIASGGDDNKIKLWSVKQQKLIDTLTLDSNSEQGHQPRVNSVAFSSDGKYLVSGSGGKQDQEYTDNTVKLWNVENIQKPVLIRSFDGHQNSVNSVAFSPKSEYIASGSGDKTIKLWDVERQELIHTLILDSNSEQGHLERINSVAFSNDGKYLVSGSGKLNDNSRDNTVKLWNVENVQKPELIKSFDGHQNSVNSVAFSSQGKYIVSGSGNLTSSGTVKLWDVEQQKLIYTYDGHQKSVNSVAFSPDDNYIASSSGNLSIDGRDNVVKLWDIERLELIETFIKTFNSIEQRVDSVALSPKGRYIATGNEDMKIKLWEVGHKMPLKTFDDEKNNHQERIFAIAFSPNGNYIVSGSRDATIKLWDVYQHKLIDTFSEEKDNGHKEAVEAVAFSNNGQYIVSGSHDNTIKLWDFENRKLKYTLDEKDQGHQEQVNDLAFSSDDKYLVSGSNDKTVKLWDVKQEKLIHTFPDEDQDQGHQLKVSSVAFSNDDKYIASGSNDKTVKLWDVDQKKLILTFDGHQQSVDSVAFSPGGKYIISGSKDKTVKLWDIKQRKLIHTFNGHQEGVFSVAFKPDSDDIISSSQDNEKMKVNLWRGVDLEDWLKIACDRIRLHSDVVYEKTDDAKDAATTCIKNKQWTSEEQAELLVKQGFYLINKETDLEDKRKSKETQKKFKEAKKKYKQAKKIAPDNRDLTDLKKKINQ